jgi:hypothetical protein
MLLKTLGLAGVLILVPLTATKAQDQPVPPAQAQTGMSASQGQLRAVIVGSHDKTIYVKGSQGVAIPLEVTRDTRLDGEPVGRLSRIEPHLQQHYPPGSEVEIVFEVRHGGDGEMENIATSIARR